MARPKRFLLPDIDSPDWKNPHKEHSFEEFYIPAKDEDGSSHRIYCNIPEQMHGWLTSIYASKKFPFQREGDMVRYFIFLGLCQLSNIDQSVPDMRPLLEAAARTAWHKEASARVMDHVEYISSVIANLQKHHAWAEIVDVLEEEHTTIEKMRQLPKKSFWARRWAEELESRFAGVEAHARSQCGRSRKSEPKAPDTCTSADEKAPEPEYIDLSPSSFYHDETEEI